MTINETNAKTATASESGTEVFIPLNKLKKSPRNARKTPHSEAIIEAYAASIAAKGIFQNLVVEPELDGEGAETGFYFVSIGEGRRLAQLLRVKRKQIKNGLELLQLWIDRNTLLLTQMSMQFPGGDVKVIRLDDMAVNVPVTEASFEIPR